MKAMKRNSLPKGWAVGPAPWLLSPAGAIYHPGQQVAVITDMHLGYEQTRGQAGDTLPAFETSREIHSLAGFLDSVPVKKLVVAGDLVESRRNAHLAHGLIHHLYEWILSRDIEPLFLAGNHDPSGHHLFTDCYIIDHWHIVHGHIDDPDVSKNKRVTGHLHPVLQLESRDYKTFLVSDDRIILPAFSHNASGVNFLSDRYLLTLAGHEFRAWVCSPGQVLNFGCLSQLTQKIS